MKGHPYTSNEGSGVLGRKPPKNREGVVGVVEGLGGWGRW